MGEARGINTCHSIPNGLKNAPLRAYPAQGSLQPTNTALICTIVYANKMLNTTQEKTKSL